MVGSRSLVGLLFRQEKYLRPFFFGGEVRHAVLRAFHIDLFTSFDKDGAVAAVAGMVMRVAVCTVGFVAVLATRGPVAVMACSARVVLGFAVAGQASPPLASNASEGFFLVFLGVKFFFVDVEAVTN